MTKKHLISAFFLISLFVSASAYAQLSEHAVKASYIFNFMKFIEWPGDNGEKRSICTIGQDPFLNILDDLNENSGNHYIIRRNIGLSDTIRCDLLFISKSEESNLGRILRKVEERPVVTIGETDNFAAQGGMIGFVRKADTIKFEVNIKAANAAGIKISSKLLQLAVQVVR